MFRHWPYPIIHIKFGEDWMRNGQVIAENVTFSSVISEPLSRWWCHLDVRTWCLGSNNALKCKYTKYSLVINEPWSRWWRHHDVRTWCLGSNLTYLHSKGVRNALKRKYTKYFLVINKPWSRWWRHHDVIIHSSSLTQSHHSYQVWWRLDEKWLSYCAKCTIFVHNQWTVKPVMMSSWHH